MDSEQVILMDPGQVVLMDPGQVVLMDPEQVVLEETDMSIILIDGYHENFILHLHRDFICSFSELLANCVNFYSKSTNITINVPDSHIAREIIHRCYGIEKKFIDNTHILNTIICEHRLKTKLSTNLLYNMIISDSDVNLYTQVVNIHDYFTDDKLLISIKNNLMSRKYVRLSQKLIHAINEAWNRDQAVDIHN